MNSKALKHRFYCHDMFGVLLCIETSVSVLEYVPYGDLFTLWSFHGYLPELLSRVYIAEMAIVLGLLTFINLNMKPIYRK